MATARHDGRQPVMLRRQKLDEGADGSPFEFIDRPLRLAAGEDAVLLRIFRGTLIGTLAAAVGAITCAAIW